MCMISYINNTFKLTILSLLLSLLGLIPLYIIIKTSGKLKRKLRIILVIISQIFLVLTLIPLFYSVLVYLIFTVEIYCNVLLITCRLFIANTNLSNYIAYTVFLISIYPLMLMIFKVINVQKFSKTKNGNISTDLMSSALIYWSLTKLPRKLILKIAQLIVAVITIIGINTTNIKQWPFGSAIVTSIAIDSIISSISNKYKKRVKKIDEKIFRTTQIKNSTIPIFKKLICMNFRLLKFYIDTGVFSIDKIRSDSKK